MEEIRTIKLEILRQGPAHNQLLSPLTPYIALCGSDGPIPIKIPFEHQQLLNRLERLRYAIRDGSITNSQREAEVRELGGLLGEVLGQIPSLLSTLCSSQLNRKLNHIRLTLSANEMSLLPFELAIGTNGFPGAGSPLLLQSQGPITLTREVRRSQLLPVNWDRPVRILFAFNSPPTLAPVPAQDHLEALRRAIDPFVAWSENPEARIEAVKNILTVLPDASLEDIRAACDQTEYSHVHILAHGAPITDGGTEHHYGLALRDNSGTKSYKVTKGDLLAMALTSSDHREAAHRVPTCVTLATCDSATLGTVIAPGGSIAHALHAGGIPWVVASQFPLWMHASTIAAEQLYRGLLNGDDPRWLLHLLRQRLYTNFPDTHDWGSIVAYAIVPTEFEQQLEQFHNRQVLRSIDMLFHKVEQMATGRTDGEVGRLLANIRDKLERWRDELSATHSPRELAKCLAMCGASEKRIGIYCAANKQVQEAIEAYAKAVRFYRQSAEATPDNHWAITQYLSLSAVLNLQQNSSWRPDRSLLEWWAVARHVATLQLDPRQAMVGEDRAWSLGTMAELELLGAVYGSATPDVDRLIEWCQELVEMVGGDSFPARSTLRQFQRYRDFWPQIIWQRPAEQAIAALMAP